jgi:polyhydroxyalkanoate synthesis regulator phasin
MGDSTLDDDERTMRDWVDAVTERDEWNACIPQWITALLARLEVARSELRTLRAENEMLRGDVQMLRDIVTKLETHND